MIGKTIAAMINAMATDARIGNTRSSICGKEYQSRYELYASFVLPRHRLDFPD